MEDREQAMEDAKAMFCRSVAESYAKIMRDGGGLDGVEDLNNEEKIEEAWSYYSTHGVFIGAPSSGALVIQLLEYASTPTTGYEILRVHAVCAILAHYSERKENTKQTLNILNYVVQALSRNVSVSW